MNTLKDEIEKTVIWLAQVDLNNNGVISEGTKEAAEVQRVKVKAYTLHFFRPPFGEEIGPQGELLTFACKSKSDALKTGKNEAAQRGWRFLGITNTQKLWKK